MKKDTEPWHELLYVCPQCRKEFRPQSVSLHVRLCPDCEKKKKERASVMREAAKYATTSRASTGGLLEGIVWNR
jgi:DNA-directed RNA polymerase subunit RPC12/RpoP